MWAHLPVGQTKYMKNESLYSIDVHQYTLAQMVSEIWIIVR